MQQPDTNTPLSKKLIVTAASVGGFLEMYDFVIYIFFAPLLAKLFFPKSNHFAGILLILAIFACGYFVRPIGALLFGHYGDRVGRRKGLLITLTLMAVATVLMGLVPTYTQVGEIAPFILFILRIIQGIAVGGDLPGAITFVAEYAAPNERGLLCSLIFFGVNAGVIIASGVSTLLTTILSSQALMDWGWRLAFIASVLLVIVGLYFRRQSIETPLFKQLVQQQQRAKLPLMLLLTKHIKPLIKGTAIMWLFAVIIAQIFLYMPTYLQTSAHLIAWHALLINTMNLVFFTALIPVMGYLSDRVGRKPLLLTGAALFLITSYPLYRLIDTGHWYWIICALILFSIYSASIIGTTTSTLAEFFTTNIRYSGVALTYNIGFAIFGGLTPLVATYLIVHLHDPAALSINLILAAAICLLLTYLKWGPSFKAGQSLDANASV